MNGRDELILLALVYFMYSLGKELVGLPFEDWETMHYCGAGLTLLLLIVFVIKLKYYIADFKAKKEEMEKKQAEQAEKHDIYSEDEYEEKEPDEEEDEQ